MKPSPAERGRVYLSAPTATMWVCVAACIRAWPQSPTTPVRVSMAALVRAWRQPEGKEAPKDVEHAVSFREAAAR
jgi:hypothetical protein